MMNKQNSSRSRPGRRGYIPLRRRLLLYFVVLSILSTVLFFAYYLYRARESLLRNLSAECSLQLSHVMENAASCAAQTGDFANRICTDKNVLSLLERTAEEAAVFDTVNEEALAVLQQQVIYFPLNPYMLSVIVRGTNGTDIRRGQEGYLLSDSDIEMLIRAETDTQHFCGAMPNPNPLTDSPEIITCHRIIYHPYTHSELGHILIIFSPSLFRHILEENVTAEYEGFSLLNQRGEKLYAEGSGPEGEQNASERSLRLSADSSVKEWTGHLYISSDMLSREFRNILQSSVLLLVLIAISFFILSVILARDFTAPIYRMGERVQKISAGDFSTSPPARVPGSEVDELEVQIQKMGEAIADLIKQKDEKQKLELQMLQAQLNPHFLNNTLNTIRMMAAMQGKNGIAEMIGALGTLVRANLQNSRELIPLSEEKELFDSYIYIQNVRMKGLVTAETDIPEELLDLKVLKFILQPVAENAVLHGIGSNPLGGTIRVSAHADESALYISVEDDGRGMPEETLRKLNETIEHPDRAAIGTRAHGTALPNIQMRIRLRWGAEYGIRVTSSEGRGTRVSFRLPILANKEGKEGMP